MGVEPISGALDTCHYASQQYRDKNSARLYLVQSNKCNGFITYQYPLKKVDLKDQIRHVSPIQYKEPTLDTITEDSSCPGFDQY